MSSVEKGEWKRHRDEQGPRRSGRAAAAEGRQLPPRSACGNALVGLLGAASVLSCHRHAIRGAVRRDKCGSNRGPCSPSPLQALRQPPRACLTVRGGCRRVQTTQCSPPPRRDRPPPAARLPNAPSRRPPLLQATATPRPAPTPRLAPTRRRRQEAAPCGRCRTPAAQLAAVLARLPAHRRCQRAVSPAAPCPPFPLRLQGYPAYPPPGAQYAYAAPPRPQVIHVQQGHHSGGAEAAGCCAGL